MNHAMFSLRQLERIADTFQRQISTTNIKHQYSDTDREILRKCDAWLARNPKLNEPAPVDNHQRKS